MNKKFFDKGFNIVYFGNYKNEISFQGTTTMEKEKQKILEFAQEKYLREGFYKITMDELANQLKMSKKTIYKYFPSKENLVKEVTFGFITNRAKEIKTIVEGDFDAVTKFFKLIGHLSNVIVKVSERWTSDVQLFTPSLWKEIDKFRAKIMFANIIKIIQQGITEGYFVNQPPEIIVTIFVSSIRGIVNPEFIMNNKFSVRTALVTTSEILMNGIMTEKGKKVFKLLKSEQLNEDN
jgi:AcrR family transcriptional regulator